MNLIEKARLTPEECAKADTFYLGKAGIAAAQLAKALWAVADWLLELEDRRLARKLKEMLEEAGMEHPK